MLTVLGQRKGTRFHVSDIGEAQTARPLATFAARGVIYYLHTDSASEAVLEALGLRRADHELAQGDKSNKSKKKDDDDDDED